jgi:hypothetical protein
MGTRCQRDGEQFGARLYEFAAIRRVIIGASLNKEPFNNLSDKLPAAAERKGKKSVVVRRTHTFRVWRRANIKPGAELVSEMCRDAKD